MANLSYAFEDSSPLNENERKLYSQDYLQEDEDICDICKSVRNHDELKEVDADDKGGTAIVCNDCIAKGWAEDDGR